VGAAKLLGLPREKIIGRTLDDFVESSFKPVISERWKAFLEHESRMGRFNSLVPKATSAAACPYVIDPSSRRFRGARGCMQTKRGRSAVACSAATSSTAASAMAVDCRDW
jgi:hypothetical protein